jgi:hypothetical protein
MPDLGNLTPPSLRLQLRITIGTVPSLFSHRSAWSMLRRWLRIPTHHSLIRPEASRHYGSRNIREKAKGNTVTILEWKGLYDRWSNLPHRKVYDKITQQRIEALGFKSSRDVLRTLIGQSIINVFERRSPSETDSKYALWNGEFSSIGRLLMLK